MIHPRLVLPAAMLLAALSTLSPAQDTPATAPAAAAPARDASPQPAPKLVSNLWVDTDFRQVIQDVSSQTETVIVCDQTVQGSVSLTVKDMPLADCLERICAAGGYSFVKVKDYYIIGRADPSSPLFQRISEPQRVKLSNITTEQVKTLLHASMIPYATFDKASGTVIVTAPEPMRQRILDAIRLIDKPDRQVAIEAVVFELTQDGSKQLALDWQFKTPHISGSTVNLVSSIAYGADSDLGTYVDMTLRAIVQSRRGQVLANPRILVLNNTDAEIFVGTEKYFSLLNGQASNPYYTLQSIKAGVTLKVSPFIGEDGQITLGLEPEVSDVVAEAGMGNVPDAKGNNSSALPVVTRRHAKTVISMKDGQTVMLGGLLREQNRANVSKVPIAGDIPGLGAPFRSVSNTKEQQEVVMLITAHVVDARHAGAEKIASRLEQHYVTPLDSITAIYAEGAKK
ncbi:MAG TPA: hypothetical protein VHM90_16410 [Phycisphaerae bacterium]|jgi:type II secretory pathway component GspD/PulD (secretin)|nr:hypothetical protein [Phycisphaerae bacterium]